MGTMREKRPGVWELRAFLGRDERGRPVQISRTVYGGKREAKKRLADLDAEANAGKHGKPDTAGVTVAGLLARHFDNLDRLGRSPKTVDNYRGYADRIILPAIGAKRVRDLTALDLDRLYGRLAAAGKKPASIRMVHAILSGALAQAVKWQMVATNPARSASPPAVGRAKITTPTAVQVRQLLAEAETTNPILARLLWLGALTGARRGELCALRWTDVDIDADAGTGTVLIAHSVLDLPGRVEVKDTKGHAERRIALDPAAVATLAAHRADMERRAAEGATTLAAEAFVFSDESLDGTVLVRPDRATRFFRSVCARLGFEGLTLHGLRHWAATEMAARGDVSARTIAGRLGHADASVTLRVYAAFFPAADTEAAAHLGRLLTAG